MLVLGDCLDIMPTLPDRSVDAIISDVPYGTTSCHWDSVIPFAPMWAQLKRIIKPRGAIVLFGSQPFTSALVMSNPAWFRYEWVWDKRRATGGAHAPQSPMRAHESILVFSREAAAYYPQMQRWDDAQVKQMRRHDFNVVAKSAMEHTDYVSIGRNVKVDQGRYPDSVLRIPALGSIDPERTGHPTQKPVALMSYLVKTYTNPGDTVLDFTAGVMSTGVACTETGREFIGIEKDERYFALGQERMASAAYKVSPEAVPLLTQAGIDL